MHTPRAPLALSFALSLACAAPVDGPSPIVVDLPVDAVEGALAVLPDDAAWECSFEGHEARYVPEGARFCGRVPLGAAPDDARACAADAFAAGAAFRVVYETQGFEGETADQYLGDALGRVWVSTYDATPCAPACGGGSFFTWRCDAPTMEPDGAFACDDWEPVLLRRCP